MASGKLLDPKQQEDIRRQTHEYQEGGGRHGLYVKAQYHHQEYPKVMDTTPVPIRKKFTSESDFQDAIKDWEQNQSASIVKNKDEERAWIESHEEEQDAGATSTPEPAAELTKPPKPRTRKTAA